MLGCGFEFTAQEHFCLYRRSQSPQILQYANELVSVRTHSRKLIKFTLCKGSCSNKTFMFSELRVKQQFQQREFGIFI